MYLYGIKPYISGVICIFYDLVADGSCKVICWQPADLGGHLFVQNGKHYIGFTPTEQYSAKSAYGIKGIIEIPELQDGDPNDFMEKLFAKVRSNLAAESAALNTEQKKYETAIAASKAIVEGVHIPEDVSSAVKGIGSIEHALPSEKEAKSMLKKRLDELGIVWNKQSKAYEYKAAGN